VYDQLTAATTAAAAAGDIARIVAVADSYTTPINYIILVSLSLSLSLSLSHPLLQNIRL